MNLVDLNWTGNRFLPERTRVAAILSIVESCRRLKLSIRDYLGSVLPGLANFPIRRIAELTPAAWAAARTPP